MQSSDWEKGMNAFRLVVFIAWVVIVAITANAVLKMGIQASGDTFFGDFAHPWRAQFNGDFAIHLLGVAAWMVWRERKWPVGLLYGFLAVNLGAVFSLAYIFVMTYRANGDMRALLLGKHA
jgi:hypothetical protein